MAVPRGGGNGPPRGMRCEFRGVVQGVGFRPWIYRLATSLSLDGEVWNDAEGVKVEVFGAPGDLECFLTRARTEAPAAAVIDALTAREIPVPPGLPRGFRIVPSDAREPESLRVSIPPDLGTCPPCLSEIFDPDDRRYRYPFTNCTLCGPRFTITRDVPYDRPATTMARFRMCEACEREYRDPGDRRFHAQPNACPRCGPKLTLLGAGGDPLAAEDALTAAAAALREGLIVAVKGLGGFHLACDATSPEVVQRLRAQKHREGKPLAVMIANLDEAGRLALLSEEERQLLASVERPIVIVRRRPDAALAPGISPDSPSVGLLLAYTPLHHLLLHEAARPLVMTSGNQRDEPIALDNDEAVRRLAGIADRFLVHDRDIDARADDSVARIIDGRPALLRRARGHVPRAIAVHRSFARPVLAVGAHQKNTFALGAGDAVMLGPHVGDLETLPAYEALESMIARMERFLSIRPEIVAADLHPEYLSTRYARDRALALGIELVTVQHHHAHVAAVMAEHALSGPVLGFAWDGTGLGTDGESWGSELLLASFEGFERLATLRPMALAGGDRAVQDPFRVALAVVDDAFDGSPPLDRIAVLASRPDREVTLLRRMIALGLHAPHVHGMGRLFDAVGALALGRASARHEAELATAVEWAADPGPEEAYPFSLDLTLTPWQIDHRPLVRALVADVIAGVSPGRVSARFHEALAAIAATLVREATRRHGARPVVLSGGCFQNARLVSSCLRALAPLGVSVHRAEKVPSGDGGLALGQALIAA